MKKRPVKLVLLVESNLGDAQAIAKMFDHQGSYAFAVAHAASLEEAERYLAEHTVNVVLLSFELPDAPGLEAVRRVAKQAAAVSVVILCSPDNESIAFEAMHCGAQDCLLKGQIEPHEMMRCLRCAVERKSIEDALFYERGRAQVTLDCIADGIICTDFPGRISYLNPIAEAMTGWSLKEASGRLLAEVFHITNAETGKTASNPMLKEIGHNRPTQLPVNCRLTRPDGHEILIEDSVAPIHDRAGMACGYVLVFRDVTQARALSDEVAHLAEHDALTGLPNRLLLRDRLDQAIARAHRNASRIAIAILDLDGFKHINDSLGHSIGDQLLRSVATRLKECVRAPDTVSHQGGDEFVLLLQDVQEPEDVAAEAIRILHRLSDIHSVGSNSLFVSASVGISIFPEDGVNAETLIQNADTAMYQAKEAGCRTYRFFTAEMNARAVERQYIEESLRLALERQEFALHYQPKFNLQSGAITGAEALLRWRHPTRGFIPPSEFISVAEETGLIHPIGLWVLGQACAQAKAWTDADLPGLAVAVNVSAVQFRDIDFLDNLNAVLAKSGLDPRFLELEITESTLMSWDDLETTLNTLRKTGVRISIDDFGTGYSSLSYIRTLSLDSIKIDQSFVRHISTPPVDTTIVSVIIGMARSLKLLVIAEGVEMMQELEFLKSEGCDEAQGYYFSRPVPADQFARLLKSQRVLN